MHGKEIIWERERKNISLKKKKNKPGGYMNGVLLLEKAVCDADNERVITYMVKEKKVLSISI